MSEILNLDPLALGQIVLRTSIVYVALLVGLRASGKRELGQMSPFDLLVIIVISDAVQNSMIGEDTSLTGGLVAAGTLLVINHGVSVLREKIPWLGQRLEGSPTLLIYEGSILSENLKREGVTADELMEALREHGVVEVQEVKLAVLEVNGTISVIPKER